MPVTPDSIDAVFAALHESHPQWPHSTERDTVRGNPRPLAWDAAAFIETWFDHPDHNDLEEALCHVPFDPWDFGYNVTDWHSKREPRALLRAHILRIVKGWGGETALINYLDENPALVTALGFEDGVASKSTL